MPLLYLAKVNLNSNIFDVYDKKLKLNKIAARWPAKAVTQFFFS